jgi:hypothetical protein
LFEDEGWLHATVRNSEPTTAAINPGSVECERMAFLLGYSCDSVARIGLAPAARKLA